MVAFLKLQDAEVADLQKKLQASKQHAATQQLIRDFDEKGISGILRRMTLALCVSTLSCRILLTLTLGSFTNNCPLTTGKLPSLRTFPS